MENAVEALKVAGAVLIFVLALSVTISSFNTISQAVDNIFNSMNREQYVTDQDGNYLNYINFDMGIGTRKVGIETIIPMIFRAYKENFAIYFYNSDGTDMVLYRNSNGEDVNYFDLKNENYAEQKTLEDELKKLLKDKLYNELKNKTFIEQLGEYYMEDVAGETDTAEVNKTKKRVVAYKETN